MNQFDGNDMGDELVDQALEAQQKARDTFKRTKGRLVRNSKKTSEKSRTKKGAAKKATKAAGKAAKKAAVAVKKVGSALVKLIATHPLIALIVIVCLALFFLLIFILTNNNSIFSVLLKLDALANLEDTKERVANTLNDDADWRFYYNKLLPEEQYDYIYFGNTNIPEKTGDDEVLGLYNYIVLAYKQALNAFTEDLGNLEQYHYDKFGSDGSSVSIEEFEKINYETPMSTNDIVDWIASANLSVTDPSAAQKYLDGSNVYYENGGNGSYYDRIIKFREGQTDYGKTPNKNFDYLVLDEKEDDDGKEVLELRERYVLNLDLSYLANHDTLVGDIEVDGTFKKESEITNIINYLIAGMDVATCGISPSGGYLDFVSATIGNEDVFDPALKFKGKFTMTGLLDFLFGGDSDALEYALYMNPKKKVEFKFGDVTHEEVLTILDTTACEVKCLDGTLRAGAGPYGEDVYEYYIVMKSPIDTDRLLWSMFVSDAARSYTYQNIFKTQIHKYQGSYYEVYSMFEPGNATLERGWFSKLKRSWMNFWDPENDEGLARAKTADATEIRKYLYGLNFEERNDPDEMDYFKEAWDNAESNENKEYKRMLEQSYLVDLNGDGCTTYDDFWGVLNETYYSFQMRPLYKCDYFEEALGIENMKSKHNLMHDGYGANFSEISENPYKCLWHRIFKNDDNSNCTSCIQKSGGIECNCSLSGINCTDWASDWAPQCPGCSVLGFCGALAQRSTGGKIKIEYIRDPKPEFAPIISISEKEYKEHINNDEPLYFEEGSDLGAHLSELQGNDKVDLKTNYNRRGWGEINSANKFYFSYYEFWGEYALKEEWADTKISGETVDSDSSWDEGSADLIEFTPNPEIIEEFETLQEISEEDNRTRWEQWAEAKKNGEAYAADYRAVSVLSELYKKKYYYHNLLNMDSYYADYYSEENFDRPLASEYAKSDGTLDTAAFDKSITSEDAEDTAFYNRNVNLASGSDSGAPSE